MLEIRAEERHRCRRRARSESWPCRRRPRRTVSLRPGGDSTKARKAQPKTPAAAERNERSPAATSLGGPAAAPARDPGAARDCAPRRGGCRCAGVARGGAYPPGRPTGALGGGRPGAPGAPPHLEPGFRAQRHRGRPAYQPGAGTAGRRCDPSGRRRRRADTATSSSICRRGRGAAGAIIAGHCSGASPVRRMAWPSTTPPGRWCSHSNALAEGRDVADLPRRADRDRRLVPHSRHHGQERSPAARSRHHQPHPPRRLPPRAGRGSRRDPDGASVELRATRIRDFARAGRAGRARRRSGHSLPL